MEFDVRLCSIILVFLLQTISAQERCGYIISIPREDRPENFPDIEFNGEPWSERPLLPGPDREDVCMDGYYVNTATLGTQVIYMEEEIEGDVTIARLNYAGDAEPYILPQFGAGSFNMLQPVLSKMDDEWFLIITEKQDYETPGMQQYYFSISVAGESRVVGVSLQIVNIDDNAPIIQLLDTCRVPELGEPRMTDCEYVVTDADGEISIWYMNFKIESDRADDLDLFHIVGTNIPGNMFTMYMTVGINRALDFEENALHIFDVTAMDSLPNNHTVTLMVQVENVEHRPPRWVEIFAVQQFDEKTYQNFTVRAIDGDTGINKPIYYRLETEERDKEFFRIETIPGGREGAIFYVDYIDRDELEREVFQLSIIAYKYDNESFATAAPIVIIINDINDNEPEPIHDEYRIWIEEETAMTLELEEFGFHDRDLGQHAQYTVHLESVSPPGAHDAFYISPTVGYQRQLFIMGTKDHHMLDFEVPEFQNIILRVVATDMNNTEFVGVAMLYINLENWNDELPMFEETNLVVSFDETEGEGFYVGRVRANDRDIGDRVEHTLMGNAGDFLRIDQETGDIYVTANDYFDYHRQNMIFVQVRADDTLGEPYHTNTSQLVIELLDINNTPPTLRLPRGSPHVEENKPIGFVITEEITATDPDTTAHLVFEIDWKTTYATKQGRETDPREYLNCVEIQTVYPDPDNLGVATGHIVVQEVRDSVTIDYEEFEVLYLTVRVRDLNTLYGDDIDESTFTITIVDLNDNPPVWVEGTLEQEFRVRETSLNGVVIGSVLAIDIDGPLYNQVKYTITPRNNTPEGLVMINFLTGQLTVDTSGAIDADIPPRWNLYYTLIATDKCFDEPENCPPDDHYFETEGEIAIFITDTNNRYPMANEHEFDSIVYIYENATDGDEVTFITATDLDRDDIYNTVRYQINYQVNPRLLNFFAVDLDSGRLFVQYTTNEVLDRDRGEAQHQIFFYLIDNFYGDGEGNRNQNQADITVVLLDVNDNAPELPDPSDLYWSLSENLAANTAVLPIIHAPDIDEPGTDNSLVGFEVLSLTASNRDIIVPDLFTINSIDTDKGELVTLQDLRGYWGTYSIHIYAYDHGIPKQDSEETYELIIRPYNYHAPEFVFPLSNSVIRLAREPAIVNNVLVKLDGNLLDRITATDEDGLEAGIATFEVIGNEEAVQYFDITNDGTNLGSLTLKRAITEDHQEFQMTLLATDGGTEPGALSTESTFRVVFVPITGNPVFSESTAEVAFIEKEAGMSEQHQLLFATDPKNYLCEDDCHDIFYSIVDGNYGGHFGLDPNNNILYLVSELDRNVSAVHTLVIAASNSLDTASPTPGSTLTVTVNVREADPRPIFDRELYTAGISAESSTINSVILTVRATHSEGAPITYSINHTSMAVDPSLESVKDSAFILNSATGVLTLNMQPSAFMHGMFEFSVVATDPDNRDGTALVRIYLISSQNRVIFRFVNELQTIEDNVDFIAQTFTAGFRMTCNIDQVLPATDDLGLPMSNMTEVRSHFIRDNQPVLADEIEELRSDSILLRDIQASLNMELLRLYDIFTDISPDVGTDPEQVTIYTLGALAVLFAFLSLIMLVCFVVRIRILNRRLEALSMTKYGSEDSGLNRIGIIAAPGTNKHAVEGSNPIWNEAIKAPDFDAISDASNDSDLIGIEDLPQFNTDYFPQEPGRTNGIYDDVPSAPIASHNNNTVSN